jgi:hypothetical protein
MPAQTPLFIYFKQGVQHRVTNRMITEHLRTAGIAVNQPNDYTVGALRNTGAQSLLQAQTPLPMIKLIGRWRSDFDTSPRALSTSWHHTPRPCSAMPTNHTRPKNTPTTPTQAKWPKWTRSWTQHPGLDLEAERRGSHLVRVATHNLYHLLDN